MLTVASSGKPARKLAVLACMDARLNPAKVLGLQEGDAHVIRNAGGVVSDDALRFTDDEFADQLESDTGERPDWPIHTFEDLDASVRDSIAKIKSSPFVPKTDSVRGYVYEVETGRLREVS